MKDSIFLIYVRVLGEKEETMYLEGFSTITLNPIETSWSFISHYVNSSTRWLLFIDQAVPIIMCPNTAMCLMRPQMSFSHRLSQDRLVSSVMIHQRCQPPPSAPHHHPYLMFLGRSILLIVASVQCELTVDT